MIVKSPLILKGLEFEIQQRHLDATQENWKEYIDVTVKPLLREQYGVKDFRLLRIKIGTIGSRNITLYPIVRLEGFMSGDVKKFGQL